MNSHERALENLNFIAPMTEPDPHGNQYLIECEKRMAELRDYIRENQNLDGKSDIALACQWGAALWNTLDGSMKHLPQDFFDNYVAGSEYIAIVDAETGEEHPIS